jgi:hypothetical protein
VDKPEDIADDFYEAPKPDPLTTAVNGIPEDADGDASASELPPAGDEIPDGINPAPVGEVTAGSGPGLYQLRSPGLRPHRRTLRPAFALRNDCPPNRRRQRPQERPRTRLI